MIWASNARGNKRKIKKESMGVGVLGRHYQIQCQLELGVEVWEDR